MYDIGTVRGEAGAAMSASGAPFRDTLFGDGADGDRAPARSVTGSAYREAMARLASAVHLITSDGPGGRAGFTATAVCSVSDAPPTLLVCVNRASSAYAAIGRNDALCVSTLGAEHDALARAFGGGVKPHERFALAEWTRLATGAPVLVGALVAFDCRITARHPAGTHDVLFCEVQALSRLGESEALVYSERGYQSVPRQR
jgi:flavin reductase